MAVTMRTLAVKVSIDDYFAYKEKARKMEMTISDFLLYHLTQKQIQVKDSPNTLGELERTKRDLRKSESEVITLTRKLQESEKECIDKTYEFKKQLEIAQKAIDDLNRELRKYTRR